MSNNHINDSVHINQLLEATFHEILYNCQIYRPCNEFFKTKRILGKVVQHCKVIQVEKYIRSSVEQAYHYSQSGMNIVLVVLDIHQQPCCRFSFDISYSSNNSDRIGEEGFKTIFQRLTASLMTRWDECRQSAEPHGFKILFYTNNELNINATGNGTSSSSSSQKIEITKLSNQDRKRLEANTNNTNNQGQQSSSSSSSSSSTDQDGDEKMRQVMDDASGRSFVHRPLPLLNVGGFSLASGIEIYNS